ncbi:putative endoplasmic reticulum retention receptor [Neospora caninum Liverpool]|uniref:Endoplasmic reticulum retention receptor,putative n=1 Tax=Neospora caninum (strain Liverpool) TaxID=572307 RepID=F0VRU3_NEOCL|nr:putative endoplasmic reticulum retention receptor [Neospora caninum Liverpool]CBZ56441.1 putative endoplasmic reticulum retention receptor [Neospora caninum Liverpool]CEL71200.1 TPA: endoplasmic reticulum retention receptor,putative [Neospora caninum Liverpool]|eukprot:XP_003886466.1 putative endoplasmic reticulum retention receptor [Neospora caninum Liverpool]
MAQNVFRLSGDMLHLVSIFLLLFKLYRSKNCAGLSARMQECYLIVFCCRYVDLTYSFISVYNSAMKAIFILSTAYLVFLMKKKVPISQTYDAKADSFNYLLYLVPPCAIITLVTADSFSVPDLSWTFSIWFESVAILPQLLLLQRQREVENLTSHYVACMGLYRLMYILNWIYRYLTESPPHVNVVSWVGGVVQTLLYADFFYYYVHARWYGHKLVLPVVGGEV